MIEKFPDCGQRPVAKQGLLDVLQDARAQGRRLRLGHGDRRQRVPLRHGAQGHQVRNKSFVILGFSILNFWYFTLNFGYFSHDFRYLTNNFRYFIQIFRYFSHVISYLTQNYRYFTHIFRCFTQILLYSNVLVILPKFLGVSPNLSRYFT